MPLLEHPQVIAGRLTMALSELRRRIVFDTTEAQIRQFERVTLLTQQLEVALEHYGSACLVADLALGAVECERTGNEQL